VHSARVAHPHLTEQSCIAEDGQHLSVTTRPTLEAAGAAARAYPVDAVAQSVLVQIDARAAEQDTRVGRQAVRFFSACTDAQYRARWRVL
jgi:hypothetical protein